jgi:hypothetical protein
MKRSRCCDDLVLGRYGLRTPLEVLRLVWLLLSVIVLYNDQHKEEEEQAKKTKELQIRTGKAHNMKKSSDITD